MRSSNSAFEASVCIRGRPVKEVHHRGRTYVEGRKGSEYTLRFRNNQFGQVLVVPSVDGLCVIDGKPAGRDSSGFIVNPHETIEIPGWVVDNNTVAKFTFWPQDARGEQTYVEELKREGANVDPGNQGLIGFMVFDEGRSSISYDSYPVTDSRRRRFPDYDPWKSIPDVPGPYWGADGESFNISGSAASSGMNTNSNPLGVTDDRDTVLVGSSASVGPLGTKFGEAEHFSTRFENFNRGRVVAKMVIEYDTLRGLKDRGVPVELFKGSRKKYAGRSAFPADTEPGCKPPRNWRR